MYSLLTSAILMFVLTPGILIPAFLGAFYSALVHALVFYIVLTYVSNFVPWWVIWILAAFAFYSGSRPTQTGGSR
jgi:fatty-acid desaturase